MTYLLACFAVVDAMSTMCRRVCEYDEDTLEYWVNTRTSGTLSREDLEQISRTQTREGEVSGDQVMPDMDLSSFGGFPELGASMELSQEGDSRLNAPGWRISIDFC